MQIKEYYVGLNFPDKLSRLESLAYNLWWTYNNSAKDLFKMINPDLWWQTQYNPIEVIQSLSTEDLSVLEKDQVFLSRLDNVWGEYIDYIKNPKWFESISPSPDFQNFQVAYFSAEYGIHESLQTYAGGLGILSGDHCKSASDLGIPFVAVGLLYRNGYFHQYLNSDGWQLETYPYNEFMKMPISRIRDENGNETYIEIEAQERIIYVRLWQVDMGFVRFILLDTDIDKNSEEDRAITGKLYDGDMGMRIKQEIILGVGGIRALTKLGIGPTVYHINEGHPAFSFIERLRNLVTEKNLSFDEAVEFIKKTTVFTTHTPVPAGFDKFSQEDIFHHLGPILDNSPVKPHDIMGLGRFNPADTNEPFSMAVCGVKMSAYRNGVSKLHGSVSKTIFSPLWPELNDAFIPIDYITNGIHLPTWISDELKTLYNRYLGENWHIKPYHFELWENVDDIPDLELFEAKQTQKVRLVEFIRTKVKSGISFRGGSQGEMLKANEILNPNILTLGFARRFASYKRAALLFSDTERLNKILNNPDLPVQIIIAGKAHPKDTEGKEIIKKIYHIARQPEFRDKIAFVEDYDIEVAKYIVRGVDVWINTPRRPMEASGTSGMKVAANGGLNFSILDGWWVEGYNGYNGWTIGAGEEYEDYEYQDYVEAQEIYDKLEHEITPLFYDKDKSGLPRQWIQMMKASIKEVCMNFNTTRMVKEYYEKFYAHLHKIHNEYIKDDFKNLKDFIVWKNDLKNKWKDIKIVKGYLTADNLYLGEEAELCAEVYTNGINPQNVAVYAIMEFNSKSSGFNNPIFIQLNHEGEEDENLLSLYKKKLTLKCAGKMKLVFAGFPTHDFVVNKFENNMVIWE